MRQSALLDVCPNSATHALLKGMRFFVSLNGLVNILAHVYSYVDVVFCFRQHWGGQVWRVFFGLEKVKSALIAGVLSFVFLVESY